MRLPPQDNSRLTLEPYLQWISGVCPDVSIKTSQNMLSFIEGKLSEEGNYMLYTFEALGISN
jgi:hypothetical protein